MATNQEDDEGLAMALEISRKEADERERRRMFDSEGGGNTSEKFNIELRPESFGSQLQKAFGSLFANTLFSDVTLILHGERMPAHRVVLCSWSETFRAMMENSTWKESGQKELKIEVDEKETEVFRMMIQYMYTGYLKLNVDHLATLLALSNYYSVLPLKEACGKFLGENLSEENVFSLLELCDRYDCISLRKMCAAFLANNFVELMQNSTRIMQLDADTWAEILKNDDILVNTEEDIFESVIKYCDQFNAADPKEREKRDEAIKKIMPSVRFPLLTNQFLIEKVEQNKTLQHIPLVHSLLHETFRYKAYPSCKPRQSVKPRKCFCSFDMEGKPPTIKISADGKTATYTGQSALGWVTTNVLPPFSDEPRYIEFKINAIGSGGVFVGIGSVLQKDINVGSTTTSWGYMSTGQLYVNGNVNTHYVGYSSGDRIGVLLNVVKGVRQLQFFKNGVSLGEVATFNNTTTSGTKLYPQVTFYTSNDSITIMPTASPGDISKKTSEDPS